MRKFENIVCCWIYFVESEVFFSIENLSGKMFLKWNLKNVFVSGIKFVF